MVRPDPGANCPHKRFPSKVYMASSEDGGALSQRPEGDTGVKLQESARTDALLPLDRRQETAADVHVAGEARTEGPMLSLLLQDQRVPDALVLEQQRQLQIVKAKTMFEVRWSSLSVCPAAGDFWT